MINQEKIQEWVREYLKHIQEISIEGHVNKEEGYKFNSIDNFFNSFFLIESWNNYGDFKITIFYFSFGP